MIYSTLCSEAEKVTSNNKSDAVKGMCCSCDGPCTLLHSIPDFMFSY